MVNPSKFLHQKGTSREAKHAHRLLKMIDDRDLVRSEIDGDVEVTPVCDDTYRNRRSCLEVSLSELTVLNEVTLSHGRIDLNAA